MILAALEAGLKFLDFFSVSLRSSRILRPSLVDARLLTPGPDNNSRILETDSRGPETEAGGLEIELRVHRIPDTVEPGLQKMPRSLVAPHKEGQLILLGSCWRTWKKSVLRLGKVCRSIFSD